MLSDFHLHTCVSDGELEPPALLARAAAHGIRHLAVTDHDSLGAYRWDNGIVFEEAHRLELELTVGIELDVLLDGREVHLLGYDLDLSAPALGAHLETVRHARRERARREIEVVNARLGEKALNEEEIFRPGRETFMRPHFIRPLLGQGRFGTYTEAKAWYRENVHTDVVVPKAPFEGALALIHSAGGWAALAHPGYYWKDGFPLLERLPALREQGLDGIELDYPYRSSSPELFGQEDEIELRASLQAAGEELGLRFTRGSDAHFPADLERVYGPTSSEGGAS
jgi:predicted metal-dependent phosphoesterase TrpH